MSSMTERKFMGILKIRYFTNEKENKLQIINEANYDTFEELLLSLDKENGEDVSITIDFKHTSIWLRGINMPYKEVDEKVVKPILNFINTSNFSSTLEMNVFSQLEDKKDDEYYTRSSVTNIEVITY